MDAGAGVLRAGERLGRRARRAAEPLADGDRELACPHPPVGGGRREPALLAGPDTPPGRPRTSSRLATDLDLFDPRLLVAYASLVGPLANAQLDGTLHVHPQKVVAASEVLGADARAAARRAWGQDAVVDTYASTETAGIASTCPKGGWHVSEDFVILEPVDDMGRPVPPGTTAARLLVTVLFSRTLPLIRYELTDSVRLDASQCACGLPFALLESVEGRSEDTITLAGRDGPVRVHPNVFHAALETAAPNGWQVEQQPTGLVVRLVEPADAAQARDKVRQALVDLAVPQPVVDVVLVAALHRTRLGKIRLVKALP